VLGEATYVEQITRNLLSNAAKYSPAGSAIRVTVRHDEGEVVTLVLDEGIGIGPGDEEHLFELFYRSAHASRQAAGAGIGLFVCRQLVEAMGGRIWARRPSGTGAEFGFALPVHVEEADSE
jgi:signal transduction histidine kinase